MKYYKRELANRLVYFPLLRVLVFNFWFRLVFAGFVLSLVFLALFLPRIWRMTPPGFLPVIKVSGLDMARAWSLKRSALRSMKAGDYDGAVYAWQAAVANNPANPDSLRGALRNFLKLDHPNPRYQGPAVGQTFWLLKLTGTNAADVELVSQIYDKFQLYDLTLRLLGPLEDHLSAPEEAACLKALFHSGQMVRFAARWAKLAGNHADSTPELQLYGAAYQAGWGAYSSAEEGQKHLEAALEDPDRRILANRLRLLVCAHRRDAAGYQDSLQRLVQWQSDTVLDHVLYWQLLAALGRKEEAAGLARSFPRPPATANDVRRLAETQIVLGMRDEARRFLQDNAQQSGNSPDLWMMLASLLVEDRKWEELRGLALQLRQQPVIRDTLANYSFYLEGRAELGLERPAVAAAAFEKAAQRPFEDAALGLTTAGSLLKLGYPAPARDILLPLEAGLARNPDYWQALFAAAYALKQPGLAVKAAAKAYELQPDNIVMANNYAAALLVNRERTEQAVRLTLQLVARFPDSTSAKINHALALILNRRTTEAEEILRKIDPAKLGPLEATSLYLGLFEVCFSGKRYEQAREAASHIDTKYLFPNQIEWLEEARRQMPQQQAAR